MTRRGWWGDRGPRRHAKGKVRKDSSAQVIAHELRAEEHEQRARRDAIKATRTGIPIHPRWDGHFAAKAREERDLAERYRAAV